MREVNYANDINIRAKANDFDSQMNQMFLLLC